MKKLALLLALALAAGPALAEDGAALYKAKCASCHGAEGKGDTPVGKALKVKPLAGSKLSAAEIEKVAAEGRAGTKMLAIKGLSPEQYKAVAAHVKTLK
jgi:mono/diheme cytochrome c family protein